NSTGLVIANNTEGVTAYIIGSKEEEVEEFVIEPVGSLFDSGSGGVGCFHQGYGGFGLTGEMDYTKGWGTILLTGLNPISYAGFKFSSTGKLQISGSASGPSPEP